MFKKIYVTLLATAFLASMTSFAIAGSNMDKAQGVASADKPAAEAMEKSQPLDASAPAMEAEKAAESIKAEPLKEQATEETAEAYSDAEKKAGGEAEAKIDETVGKLEQKETKE